MKILIEGRKPKPEWPKKFKCTYCGSVLEADLKDLNYVGTQYNSSIYEFYCPVCNEKRTVDDDMFLKDDEVKA